MELIGALSARFARISPDKIDSEIKAWLGRICVSLGFDRSVLAEYSLEKSDFYGAYNWSSEGIPEALRPNLSASEFLPWVSAKGAGGELVVVSHVDALPKEAARDRDFMLDVGMKAILGVPLIVGTRLVAGLTFEDFRGKRNWTPSLVSKIKLISDIFANALERKRYATEAGRLREEALGVDRLALTGEMAAAIAHELSHPLGAILANAQAARRLLESRHPDISELKEVLDDVIAGERRAAAYVAKVRSIFRRSELHLEPLDVRVILDEVLALTQGELQARNIPLQMGIKSGLPLILADRVGIEQVMLNLIHNAADAAAETGCSDRRVTVHVTQREPQRIAISVRDRGRGIDQKDLGRIFQPLFTTKPTGTGMGLAIVRSIVESHGGAVQVYSQRGSGATFEFTLPVAHKVEIDCQEERADSATDIANRRR